MRTRDDGRRRRGAWTLALLVIAAASLSLACGGGNVSVGVGVAVPGPWGGVTTVSTAVPIGPHSGRYAPMW
jgi:hypothetical protein